VTVSDFSEGTLQSVATRLNFDLDKSLSEQVFRVRERQKAIHHCDEDRLQDKLLSVDVAGHDEERSVCIARKSEKTASAVRRKHQREHDGKKMARSVRCNCRDSITKRRQS
jgi:hypothetical protein